MKPNQLMVKESQFINTKNKSMQTITKLYEAKAFKVDKTYTHFCVDKKTGKIVDGWDYKGTDNDSIKEYYKLDMKDNDRDLKEYSLIPKDKLIKQGVDPFNWDSWRSN